MQLQTNTDRLFTMLDIELDQSLVRHLLSQLDSDVVFNPLKLWDHLKNHLQKHKVDDPAFFSTTSYMLLMAHEMEKIQQQQLLLYPESKNTLTH